ncbi:MAG: hypothetical protein ACRD1D_14945 [Acidimicrobiales bacterium]
MRFRLGLVTGFAAGYYLGAKAGRQRYDQINRQLTRLRGSEAFEQAAERARSVVEEGVEKARSVVESRSGDGQGNGNGHGYGPQETSGLVAPPPATGDTTTGTTPPRATGEPPTGLGGYSSSR